LNFSIQEQPIDINLREGLRRFWDEYDGHLSHNSADLSKEARDFFHAHDIAHVIFGCDISLLGEGTVKFWTLLATDLGWRQHWLGYRSAEAYELSRRFTLREIIVNLIPLISRFFTVWKRSRRMTSTWPWEVDQKLFDRSLEDLRREFNIHVIE